MIVTFLLPNSRLLIYCQSAEVTAKGAHLTGINEHAYVDLDAEGYNFDVLKEKEILVKMPDEASASIMLYRKQTTIKLGELATGEHFNILGDSNEYVYKGGRYYSLTNNSGIFRSDADTTVIALITDKVGITDKNRNVPLDILNGRHPHFLYNWQSERVECRCGHPAVFMRKGFICGTITAYPCDYVRNKK